MTVSFTTQLVAIGLTVSQLLTAKASQFRRHFEPTETALVAQTLHQGCVVFDRDPDDPTQKMGIAELIQDASKDFEKEKAAATSAAQSAAPGPRLKGIAAKFAEIDWPAVNTIAQQICGTGTIPADSPAHLAQVIEYFNSVFKDVDDISFLTHFHPPSANAVFDGSENAFTELAKENNNRIYVHLRDLPAFIPQAFVSAEDKLFYRHGGIDSDGLMRALVHALAGDRRVGGSTIPQQLIKNVSKHSEVTFERKMREMMLAVLLTEILTKNQILEMYLNIIPLGRGTVGLGQAAKAYFGKSAQQLTLSEVAALAGINQGPEVVNPDRNIKLVDQKRLYVLGRMAEDVNNPKTFGYTDGIHQRALRPRKGKVAPLPPPSAGRVAINRGLMLAEINQARTQPPTFVTRQRPSSAFYFLNEIKRQVQDLKKDKPELADFDQGGYVVHSTIDPKIQLTATLATQDHLADLEAKLGRTKFKGAVGSIAKRVEAFDKPWSEILPGVKANVYYDVLWPLAVVLPQKLAIACPQGRRSIGLRNGKIACLDPVGQNVSSLIDYDLVFVRAEDANKTSVRLLVPPEVQSATVVLENKTGRVLALVGGFSYGASQFNRATQGYRQAGSTMKPFTYLAALQKNYQPNTLISDSLKKEDWNGVAWNLRNYDRESGGTMTLRMALENSVNVATANLAKLVGLKDIRALARELGVCPKNECLDSYTFVLGTQSMRVIDLARAYATIGNLGLMPPEVYFLEGIEKDGRSVWQRPKLARHRVELADRTSFYQLRQMMAGVVERGTAAKAMAKEFGGLVAAKTGTSQGANDAWFIGVTNEYTVATWVGYDNGEKEEPRTLGNGVTGAMGALPIAQRILRYLNYNEANPELKRLKLLSRPPLVRVDPKRPAVDGVANADIDSISGAFLDGRSSQHAFSEVFRLEDPLGCAESRSRGSNEKCDVVDSRTKLLQPGDLPNGSIPRGDGDAGAEFTNGPAAQVAQPRDDGYQPYQPDREEAPVPSYVDPRYRNMRRAYGQSW